MARPATVWWREQTQAWYATVGGQKKMLVKGKKNKREAEDVWHKFMAEEQAPQRRDASPVKVIFDLYLEHIQWVTERQARAGS